MDDDEEKARKVVVVLYVLMALGIALPVILFFLIR